jgi:ABC-type sugar transport system substrate-binding protein
LALRSFLWLACAVGVLLNAPAIPAAHAAAESKGKKIAFLQTLATHPYVVAMTKSFRGRAEALGMEVTFFTSMLDAALQAQQIDDAIARKFDFVVLVPTSEQAVVPALAHAKQAGGGNCLKEGLDAIKASKMQDTITQIRPELGVRAADVVNEYFSGQKLPKEVLLPIATVTKANVVQWEAPCTY